MIAKLSRFASPEIERLLKKLQAEEENYDAELRALDREKCVLPVSVFDAEENVQAAGFSRDISSNGVGLITPEMFSRGDEMALRIKMPEGSSISYRAVCRWSAKFGGSFYNSGWELSAAPLNMKLVVDASAKMEWDARPADRVKFAIPVTIQQKGKLPQAKAFTQDMSGDGASLIGDKEITVNSFCKLEVFGRDGESYQVIAKCVWSQQYSDQYWLTAWQFPRLDRVAKFHAASFK